MSSLAEAPERAGQDVSAPTSSPAANNGRTRDAVLGLTLTAALVALAFLTSGNSDPSVAVSGGYGWSEIVMTVLGVAACGAAVVVGARERAWGAVTVGLFAAFAAFAALSILWSVEPDWSWYGANQLLAYLAVFAGAAAMARVFPERWSVVIGGIAVAATLLAGYSLLAKVFPATLASTNTHGRLEAPFGYWNAIGVIAALGVPACLWAGSRRDAQTIVRALAVPALTVLVAVTVLSYSRSAILVAAIGAAIWIAFAPLRLRSALILGLGCLGAVPIVLWALGKGAVSSDAIALSAQDSAGHSFGLVLILVLAAATAAGFAGAVATKRLSVSAGLGHRIGVVLLGLMAVIPVAAVIGLAASSRGLFGEISHVWTTLTTSAGTGDTAARVTQFGSSRPVYWHQGLEVGGHALLKGAGELGYGIARLRYTTVPFKADQAHSFVIQTFADLGLIGVAIMVALLAAWGVSALRALAPRMPWRGLLSQQASERQGLLVLAAIAVAFGIQSALDWTWYFPGVAIPALIAAGWLAGRGPLAAPVGRRPDPMRLRDRPGAGAVLTGLAAAALIGAWAMWEPLHSAQAYAGAENANTNAAAFADARTAAGSNPLSVAPLEQLASLDEAINAPAAARNELLEATRLQPDNPEPWLELGTFYSQHGPYPLALRTLSRVVELDHAQVDNLTGTAYAIAKQTQAVMAAQRAAATARATRRSRAQRRAARRVTARAGGRHTRP